VTADQVGAVAVTASTAVGGREIRIRSQAEVDEALALFQADGAIQSRGRGRQ
jgi:hypothetical protein